MPSFRRSSSSSPRSSPYPSFLSNGSPSGASRGGHGPRRHSGSETSTRRVLADLDWWAVVDGQCQSPVAGEDSDEVENMQPQNRASAQVNDDFTNSPTISFDELDDDLFSMPFTWPIESFYGPGTPETPSTPTTPYASLAIAPRTPPQGHTRESSLEPSPRVVAETPIERLRLELENLDLGFADAPYKNLRSSRSKSVSPFLTVRSHTFSELSGGNRFADIGAPAFSSSPFWN